MFEIDFNFHKPFKLESGQVLDSFELRCSIYGKLNAEKSNAILIFHALTGNSRIDDWWNGLIGNGYALDTSRYAFVCVNYLGSCYGSTSAFSIKYKSRKSNEFPLVTVRDIVRSNVHLMEYLGIGKYQFVIGGSVGGMLALQFAIDYSQLTEQVISIAATPLSAMGLALNHLQRQAILLHDISFARKIAMISYKSPRLLNNRFGRQSSCYAVSSDKHQISFDIAEYLDYQGEKFKQRFEINSYQLITKAMDLFDLTDFDIKQISTKISMVGISSDWLFPADEVKNLANRFKFNNVETNYFEIVSDDGHDAFLSDVKATSKILKQIITTEYS